MLDHFTIAPPAGFPDHPHHGQETVTHILRGAVAHEDFTGSKGVLRAGDLQFMTAGKGTVHSEIPVQLESGDPTEGIQLWVDLPARLKDCQPRYRDLKRDRIPTARSKNGLNISVISGQSYGVDSIQELAYTSVHYYHYVFSEANISFEQVFPTDFNVFLYVLKGRLNIAGQEFSKHSSIFFKTDGSHVSGFSGSNDLEFILAGGQILDQPIVQYGPFVETSKERMMEVFQNYQSGTNGFEKAAGWTSSIANGIVESDISDFVKSSG